MNGCDLENCRLWQVDGNVLVQLENSGNEAEGRRYEIDLTQKDQADCRLRFSTLR